MANLWSENIWNGGASGSFNDASLGDIPVSSSVVNPASLFAQPVPALSTSSGSTPERDEPESPQSILQTAHAPAKHQRSTDNAPAVAHKDQRRTGAPHTHDEDEDYGSGEEQSTATGGRRKSAGANGKAPITEKRRQQNRNAQRAFRERKEAHLKNLEDTISSLQAENNAKAGDVKNLRDLVESLRAENARLRQSGGAAPSSSSFDFAVPAAANLQKNTVPGAPQRSTSTSSSSSAPFSAMSFAESPHEVTANRNKSASPLNAPFTEAGFIESVANSPDMSLAVSTPPFVQPATAPSDFGLFTPRGEHLNDNFFGDAAAAPANAPTPAWMSFRDPTLDAASAAQSNGTSAKSPAPLPVDSSSWSLDDIDSYLKSTNVPEGTFDLDAAILAAGSTAGPSSDLTRTVSGSQSPASASVATPPSAGSALGCDSSFRTVARKFGVNDSELDGLCNEFSMKATCQEHARVTLEKALASGQPTGLQAARTALHTEFSKMQ